MRSSFCNSKATFTKTAIKPKFLDRFSLKNFSAAIDQCTIISPNFVSIENFLLSNVSAKLSKYWSDVIDLATFLLWDFLLSRVKHNIKYPCSTREFTALGCPPYSIPYCFLPFYSINIFRKDFRGHPGAVNSRLLFGWMGIWCSAKLETIGNPKAKT